MRKRNAALCLGIRILEREQLTCQCPCRRGTLAGIMTAAIRYQESSFMKDAINRRTFLGRGTAAASLLAGGAANAGVGGNQ